jgi:hypothetical protein
MRLKKSSKISNDYISKGDNITMSLKIIKCVCGNQYASKKNSKAKLIHERPQCVVCGKREYK